MATGCALDADGNLKNTSYIEFFDSETDSHPIGACTTDGEPEKKSKAGLCSFTLLNFEV